MQLLPLLAAAPAIPGWHAWFTMALVAFVFSVMIFATRIPPDVTMIGAVVLLLVTGVLTPREALAGMANEGMLSVGALFVVGAGIVDTGGVVWLSEKLLGRPRTLTAAMVRLVVPSTLCSAFMNNTPLVAMLIPAVNDWARKNNLPTSKLMIPLSYAAILGGTCTLIGTSTNLVVQGMWANARQQQPNNQHLQKYDIGMFTISPIGVPAAVIGGLFIVFAARWLLPNRRPAISTQDDPREYTVEMLVAPGSPLSGKTIEDAGLRHLPGVYLAEIDRDGEVLPAVSSTFRLRENDRLIFVGVVDSIVDLQKIRGLIPATDQLFKLEGPRTARTLIEAVVSDRCPLVGRTIRDGRFRAVYNAAVIAVARNGERIKKKIGDIELRVGDTLLLESQPQWVEQQKNSRDFYLVSKVEGSAPPRHEKAGLATLILLGMVALVSLSEALDGPISTLHGALVAAGLMLMTRCVSIESARRSVDWPVLLAIAASFALGTALQKTGVAAMVAGSLVDLSAGNRWLTLAVFYLATLIITELITNNAAAALMFPFALATAENLHVSPMPFVIVVMMAASAGFATPIGYQTNLMVYGPGGYRFFDYVRVGVPLDLLILAVTVILVPFVFPF